MAFGVEEILCVRGQRKESGCNIDKKTKKYKVYGCGVERVIRDEVKKKLPGKSHR